MIEFFFRSFESRLRASGWWVLSMLFWGVFVGCRSASDAVAVIPRTTGIALWEPEHRGAEDAAAANRIRIYWNAPTREDDIQGQINLVERIIEKRYAGLVLAPDQSLALMTPVRRAISAGIPTVIVGSSLPLQPQGKLVYLLSNDEKAGQMAAKRIARILNGSGTVAVLGINQNIDGVLLRERSFEQTLALSYPGIHIIEKRMGSFNQPYETQTAEEILSAHPHLNAILAVTSDATRGAYSALIEAHRVGSVKLIGCDQDLLMPLTSGELDSIIAEDTYQMGHRAIELIAAMRDGKPVPRVIRIAPMLVTKDNLNAPEIRRILDMERN